VKLSFVSIMCSIILFTLNRPD